MSHWVWGVGSGNQGPRSRAPWWGQREREPDSISADGAGLSSGLRLDGGPAAFTVVY